MLPGGRNFEEYKFKSFLIYLTFSKFQSFVNWNYFQEKKKNKKEYE